MNFLDIYYVMNTRLLEDGYSDQDIYKKLLLIDKHLKEYGISKIQELDNTKLKLINNNTSVNEIVTILYNIIPQSQHFNTIRHFSHYILNAASNMQNFSIIWWVEEEQELMGNPTADFNPDNKWESIATHENESYLKIFEFVYETFKNKFISKNYRQPIKVLIQ